LDRSPSRRMDRELYAFTHPQLPDPSPGGLLDDRGQGAWELHHAGLRQGLLTGSIGTQHLGGRLGSRRRLLSARLAGQAGGCVAFPLGCGTSTSVATTRG
jgi:hypothetical protein